MNDDDEILHGEAPKIGKSLQFGLNKAGLRVLPPHTTRPSKARVLAFDIARPRAEAPLFAGWVGYDGNVVPLAGFSKSSAKAGRDGGSVKLKSSQDDEWI